MMALAAAVDMAAQAAPGNNRFESVMMSVGLAKQVPIGDDDFGALRKAGVSDAHTWWRLSQTSRGTSLTSNNILHRWAGRSQA